jgi:hypothetical protein
LGLQLWQQLAPEQCHMVSLQTAVLLLQHSSGGCPTVCARDAVQQVYMAKAAHEWLQLPQPAWLRVLLLLLLLLLDGCAQLLAEPPLVPAVQRHDCQELLLRLWRQLLWTACGCKHARQLLRVCRCVVP